MTTAYSTNLGLALPVEGELSGTWGDMVNNGITDYLDIAVAGTLTLSGDGAVTLANTNGDTTSTNIGSTTAQYAVIKITGTLTTTKVITAPSHSKTYIVDNSATGGTVTLKASGQTGISVAVGEKCAAYFNGTDYVKIASSTAVTGAGGSNTQVQYNSSGSLAGSANFTFDGTNIGLAGGTANGVTYLNGSKVLTSGSALQFDGSNLGLGVTPNSTWESTWKVIQLGTGGSVFGRISSASPEDEILLGANVYNNGVWRYLNNGYATFYNQNTGQHAWYTAPSGTAGSAITFTQAMTLDASGNLGVGTSSPGAKLDVNGRVNTNSYYSAVYAANTAYYAQLDSLDANANLKAIGSGAVITLQTSGTERARIDSNGTFSIQNDYQEKTYTANSSTAITLNIVANGTDQVITLTGSPTITMPTAVAGKSFLLKLKTGAGSFAVTWSTVKWPGGTAPTVTTTASKMDIFSFFSDGTNWYGCTVGQNYTP